MLDLPVYFRTYDYVTSTVGMKYPVIYGLKDIKIERKINYSIINELYKLITELRHPDMLTYITGSYEIKANERNILSITLTGLANFGGAHPMTIVKALNIDVESGKVYTLGELFKPDSEYVKVISKIVRKQIEERDIYLLGEFKGIDEEQDYYITDKCLIVYFQLYEIAPYVAGFVNFPIPLYSIQELIPEDSILQRLLFFL